MQILQNRLVAVILVACAVAVSTVVGAGISLHMERDDLQSGYEHGYMGDSRSLASYIDGMVDDCHNMLTLASRYAELSDGTLAAVSGGIEEVERHRAPGHAKWAALRELYEAVGALDLLLFNQELSRTDQTALNGLKANIDNNYHIIVRERARYNQEAQEFNRILGRFPANIISSLVGVQPLEPLE